MDESGATPKRWRISTVTWTGPALLGRTQAVDAVTTVPAVTTADAVTNAVTNHDRRDSACLCPITCGS